MRRCVLAVMACLILSAVVVVLGEDFTAFKIEKKWMVTLYHENSYRPGAQPAVALTSDVGVGGIGFEFLPTPDTAMLTTKHPSYNEVLLGNLMGKSLNGEMGIVRYDNPVFIYYDTGGDRAANVRFYFRTLDHTLGESQYWWSASSFELRYLFPGYPRFWLATAFTPGAWSDRDGHKGDADPAHVTAFAAAAADVQEIGLSFGGGNNYAFGVGVGSGSATFQLTKIWVE